MSTAIRLIIFLVLNFGALIIGGLSTGNGVSSEWYQQLNKAPWTPPGYVFGFAWTAIMICLSFFMAKWTGITSGTEKTTIIVIFAIQWVLNVAWNPVFFTYHNVIFAQVLIFALLLVVIYMMKLSWPDIGKYALLLLPYIIWLAIANSLNLYAWLKN